MPPRYAYWTIIAGGLPTAFRAAEREELLPTFQRIKEKHPDAEMKWFARGKLWDSPEAARIRHDDGRGRRPFGEKRPKPQGRPDQEKRGRDWRPGGEHRDPRQKFVDAKKQQNAALRKERWERKNAPPRAKPHGDPPRPEVRRESRPAGRDNWREWPPADRPPRDARGPQGPLDRNAREPRARHEWRPKPDASKPKPGGWKPKPGWKAKPGGWNRNPGVRGQDTEDPQQPPRPRGPDREPRRSDPTKPTPPPKPDEPKVPPPGPSERGHIKSRRPFRPRQGPPKGPRR